MKNHPQDQGDMQVQSRQVAQSSLAHPSVVQPPVRVEAATIQSFFDPQTSTYSYVVHGGPATPAVIIDPVMDYDHKSGRLRTTHAQEIVDYVRQQRLQVQWILETHAHADHLSASPWLKERLGGRVAISQRICDVQKVFSGIFDFGKGFAADGSDFDYLLSEGEQIAFGRLSFTAHPVPGHTPACMAFEIGDAIFVGDTLFMPDVGTARCDFPGGDARTLYRSIRFLLDRPASTRLFMCHDYPATSRPHQNVTTVAQQRAANIHVHDGISEAQFVAMRQARDATLEKPALILPSIQVNVRAGHLPQAASNGRRYLQIPLDVL